MTQGFSHLASTVPDSQGLQQLIDVSSSLQPLAPPANCPLPNHITKKRKMETQSSPHDTQELSPSHYKNLINVQKSKNAAELGERSHAQGADDPDHGVTQHTLHTGDPGYVDLALSDGGHEDDMHQDSEPELNSEPIDFSPTQATQNRLPQFPESQRFKTPATNGKKRNSLGEVVESPALPRNPLAVGGVTKTPLHALGLSQAFAATQAGSSPVITRHTSEPTSDRPSPNFEVQARPASASLSSPLRPRSELRKIVVEPHSRYIPLKQSQAERDRLAALRQQSLDGDDVDDQFDDDFDTEPSAVKRKRREKEQKEAARERFQRFSSLSRSPSTLKGRDRRRRAMRPNTPPPVHGPSRQPALEVTVEEESMHLEGRVADGTEDETDIEGESDVIVRDSSQLAQANDEEDKENLLSRPLQVPETVARLHQVVNGQHEDEASPMLRRSLGQAQVQLLRSSQTAAQVTVNGSGGNASPTDAVANSQPDQPLSRKLVSQHMELSKRSQDAAPVTSSPSGATQVGSSPCRAEGQQNSAHSQAKMAKDTSRGELMHQKGNGENLPSVLDQNTNIPAPLCEGSTAFDVRPETRSDDHPSTVPETLRASKSTTNGKQGSVDTALTVKNTLENQSSRYESAQTHQSNKTSASQPVNALFSSPSGRKRKRLGEIAAQPSPKKMSGETEVNEVMAAMDDSDFYNAVDNVPGSSSPIPPGRNPKRPRLMSRRIISSRATSTTAESHLPSSPPTSDITADGKGFDQPQDVPDSRTPRPTRTRQSIWDIQVSPPKPATRKSNQTAAQQLTKKPNTASKKPFRKPEPRKPSKGTAAEAPQVAPQVDRNSLPSVEEPSRTSPGNHPTQSDPTKVVAPNQVLACFNGNPRGYYPATCVSSTGLKTDGTFRYRIQWDDSTRDDIDERGICRLDLRIGDQVKVDLQGWPRVTHIVQGFKDQVNKLDGDMTDIRGFKTLLLAPKKRKSLPADVSTEQVKEAPVSAVYLDTNMWKQMKDRTFEFDLHGSKPLTLDIPQQAPLQSGPATPSEQPSTPSTPISRTRRKSDFYAQPASTASHFTAAPAVTGIFSRMVFAISYDNAIRRTGLAKAITANGGTVLSEGFEEMFEQKSSIETPSITATHNRTLVLSSGFANIGFVALIADRHSRKTKYMQALTLGIPSLSGKWIETCIAKTSIVDWQPYLLSAGESQELEGAVRSRVLPAFDARTVLMKDMIATRPGLLNDEAVVIVTGKGKAEEKRRPYAFLAKAAGAGKVEKCTDIKGAKSLLDEDSITEFKWVFVEDRDLDKAKVALLSRGKGRNSKDVRVVGNEFLCQSLILGRLWQES